MDKIDISKRKPRRTFGTPSYYYRNRFAYAFLIAGSALFALWNLTPMQRVTNEKLCALFETSEEEKDRHALFDFAAARNTKYIKEALEEKEKLMSER